jgi:hypothetical protein
MRRRQRRIARVQLPLGTMAANASEAANMATTMAANMAANTGAADWPDSYSEQIWFDKYLNHEDAQAGAVTTSFFSALV